MRMALDILSSQYQTFSHLHEAPSSDDALLRRVYRHLIQRSRPHPDHHVSLSIRRTVAGKRLSLRGLEGSLLMILRLVWTVCPSPGSSPFRPSFSLCLSLSLSLVFVS